MTDPAFQFYARWRQQVAAPVLRETAQADPPAERFLQFVWQHQRLLRDRMRLLDGRPVRVLHPGFWNREAGPDFRDAVIQFGDDPALTGDVEIDLAASNWRSHHHAGKAAYARVRLHVVWAAACAPDAALPTLALEGLLDARRDELALWATNESALGLPAAAQGRCRAPLAELRLEQFQQLLRGAAAVRLQAKAARLEARARQTGWERTLWEELFAALGYKHNAWAMRAVAEALPALQATPTEITTKASGDEGVAATREVDALAWQARMLGVAGLLPAELTRRDAAVDRYVREVWDRWWREREAFQAVQLPAAIWRFHGLRPANHPARRLALAAHWLADGRLPERMGAWLNANVAPDELANSLLEILQVEHDEFWSWHWTLRSPRLAKPQPLLGAQRATDLAVNVLLPWLWIRAVTGRNERLRAQAEDRYFLWPAAEDNATLKLARQRLLGAAGRKLFTHAALQQGLLQIVRDFCDQSNALCEQCRFPDLVKAAGVELK